LTRRISLRMSVSTDILFQPIALGTTQLTSRVVRTAHGTGMAVPHITDRFIDYFVARADGGCALSIIEASRVHPSTGNDLQLYGDQIVPGYRRLMKALRPYEEMSTPPQTAARLGPFPTSRGPGELWVARWGSVR
jgi:2,4-dienoyl-CoA reductase-like NADH-dependent reductase (Old Yellow Enzyme family)